MDRRRQRRGRRAVDDEVQGEQRPRGVHVVQLLSADLVDLEPKVTPSVEVLALCADGSRVDGDPQGGDGGGNREWR